jgi:hypothetical protein
MKNYQSVLTVLLLSLLLCGAQTLSTQSYSFPYNYTSTDGTTNSYYAPVYSLGVLQAGFSITVTVSVPNIASAAGLNDLLTGAPP